MIVLYIIVIVFLLVYCTLIFYYWESWVGIVDFRLPIVDFKPTTKITVIIPARNEEDNIAACLDTVCKQSYPKEFFEVLVVDDFSTDGTAQVVKGYATQGVKLISLKDFVADGLNSYKKKAIEIAIAQASGELIVTTDADCLVQQNWLQTVAAFYEEKQPAFIAMPVGIRLAANSKKNTPMGVFLQTFQALDFMTLQGITGASVYKKTHSMCNGANLAYTKKAFEEVGGFVGIDNIASGDDMLLMHKIYKAHPDKVLFLKSAAVIVQTEPVHSVKEFFNQRIRWASKADKYEDKRIFWVLVVVYFTNVILLVMPFISFLHFNTLSIIHYPLSTMQLWLLLLIIKTAVELIFLYPVATFFGKQKMLWIFPFFQPFHILYTVIAGWLGKFGSYSWKGRNVK